MLKVAIFVLLFAGVALSAQIGTFEGTYLSSSYGYNTWICQDDDSISGSYDQAGIFFGNVQDNVATGEWFEAGTGSCQFGNFEIQVVDQGFTGWYSCPDGSKFDWNESKTSVFRPTDAQCAFLYPTADIEGHWYGNDYEYDICFGTGSDVTESYTYDNGAFIGYEDLEWGAGGRVAWGTWYEDLSAGASLYFLRWDGQLEVYWWTGLVGLQGNTVINQKDYLDPDRHGDDLSPSRTKTSTYECGRYVSLRYYVLKNANRVEDDFDGFYFLPDYFNAEWWWFGYGVDPVEIYYSPSSASTIVSSTLVVAAALMMFVL